LLEKTEEYKTKSLLLNQETIDLFKSVKSLLAEQESEISLNALHHELFDAGMRRLHTFYADEPSSELIDMALNIIELRQNVLLKSAFKRNYLKDSHFIPMAELEKEDSLQAVVLFAEKMMLLRPINKDSVFKIINTSNESLISLRNNWKQQYPNYYQLVFEDQAVSLKETQSLLNKDQQLIAFHVSDNGTYSISITKNNFAFDFIKKPLKPREVVSLKEVLQDKNTGHSAFESQAKNMYDKLFTANSLSKTDLILIPHRHLSYVPFEVLVEKANHAATNFSDLNYLVKRFNISYTFSVSLASYGSKLKYKNKKGVLAVAPAYNEPFDNKRAGIKLSKLLFNQLEAKSILDIFGGKMLADSNSKMQQIIAEKNKFSGVHFAAHAIIDEANPDFSYLALGGDSANSKLFIKDLYNQPWQNEMVVLSACETATGHLMQGEGIISLGRAFTFSGAKSVVSSLWKINDQSTSELMGYFYGYLKQKKNKDEALRLAKLDFMANQKNQKMSHPYYWAAFVLYGDSGKMFHPSYFWFVVLGIGIIGFSIWFYKRANKGVKN
jgi:CHAT domain-containing protein